MPNCEIGAESLALLGVLDGNRQQVLRAADGERPELEPADVQNVERDNMAAANFAEHVLDGYMHVVEIDGGGRAALDPHLLLFLAGADAAESALHQKCCELLATDFSENGKQVSGAAVGDPHLLTAEDVVTAIGTQIGARFCGKRIRPGMRLGQRVRGQQLGRGQARQVALFLLLRSEIQNRQRADAGVRAVPARV